MSLSVAGPNYLTVADFDSPFLEVPPAEWVTRNRSGFAIRDQHPVSPGHTLVVSRRLIRSWWEATEDEHADLLQLVAEVKRQLDEEYQPDGFNVGFNDGVAAGQTVPHLHIHVIPRYTADVPDPRGGIRHVIPGKENYLPGGRPTIPGSGPDSVQLFDGQERMLRLELLRCLANPLLDRIDLVVSFIMRSGLDIVFDALEDALDRGAAVRVLTTDYLRVTDRDALTRLFDLSEGPDARLETRIFHDDTTSFHPKAYLFSSSDGHYAAAFVGSSNLSKSGISGGVEWNVGVDRVAPMLAAFERLWADPRSVPLTRVWLRTYRQTQPIADLVPLEVDIEPPVQPAEPRPIQREALHALEETRQAGFKAGLVVMATGLGKTWLAAFDTARQEFRRILFVAHREEILRQSRDVFRRVQPDGDFGLYYGEERRPDARVVFASIQTLARRLSAFAPDAFDYLVIDEFHHAAAASYRKVIDHFAPRFLVGLTATPERMDGADLLALCGDNLVFECNVVESIHRDELVPFHYWGVPDTVDFQPIPWRNGRFDPEALSRAVETQERAEQAFEEWESRRGTTTLAFCVSTRHADFMDEFFTGKGVQCAAVHSGTTSAPRHQSIEQLRRGDLEVIFAVDLFNEGLDVPEIDTVLMLRPTESPVVFLQQLGRGLRRVENKEALTVVDFIGNHRSFLLKPRTLLSLSARSVPSTTKVIEAMAESDFGLPPGCSVSYDLAVVDMLRQLVHISGGARSVLEEYCRSYFEEEGMRPSAMQAYRAGLNPAAARTRHGSWFGFLEHLGLLSPDELSVVGRHGDVLAGLEAEPVTKSYKLVTLRALLHDGTLRGGASISQISATSRELAVADPRLVLDTTNEEIPDPSSIGPDAWEAYWRRWPIAAWGGELRGSPGRWFRLVDDRLVPTFVVESEVGDTFDAMVSEIVEYRLGRYLLGKEPVPAGACICKLGHSDGRPLIWLDRSQCSALPEGEVSFLADGEEYTGRFVKVALNVASRPGEKGNALRALLRGWFGPSAGHPGTNHRVIIEQVDGTWILRPEASAAGGGAEVLPLFPTFEVACSAFGQADWSQHAAVGMTVRFSEQEEFDPATHFLCFARGDSMDGGPEPIRHGDLLLFEWVRGVGASELVGQTVLVEHRDRQGTAVALKVLERDGPGFQLASTNAAYPPIPADSSMQIVARLRHRVPQGAANPLAERIGEPFKRQDIPGLYGEAYNPGNWQSGHVSLAGHAVLFVTLQKSDQMAFGAEYVDHFESPTVFVWSSQASAGPDSKKGREILDSLETGTMVHLWVRRRKADVAFVYLGLMVPLTHEGDRPMSVRFRLLTPVPVGLWKRLAP